MHSSQPLHLSLAIASGVKATGSEAWRGFGGAMRPPGTLSSATVIGRAPPIRMCARRPNPARAGRREVAGRPARRAAAIGLSLGGDRTRRGAPFGRPDEHLAG